MRRKKTCIEQVFLCVQLQAGLHCFPEDVISLVWQCYFVANISLGAGLADVLAAFGVDALDVADVLQHASVHARRAF